NGLERPAGGNAGHRDALLLQLLSNRRIDARGDEGLLSVRQLLLELALDGVLANGDLADLALRDQLLELAVRDGLDRAVGRQRPLQNQDADSGRNQIARRDGLLSLG